jgi:PAS domain S-box-containing protein
MQALEHYRAIFENGHTVMLIIDPVDGRIVDANPKAESFYGWPRDVLLAMRIMDINTQSADEVRAEIEQARTANRHFFNFRHRHADGSISDVEVLSGPITVDGQTYLYSIIHDVTDKKALERKLARLARRAELLLELPRLTETLGESEFMQRGLEMAEDLTDSSISFIHFVNDDERDIELVTWSRRTLEHYCTATFERHYPVADAGLWAEALRQRRPVVYNDYAAAPDQRGLPAGHAALTRFISVPVIEQDKVVMLAGLGNKDTDYDEIDVQSLVLIAGDIWRLVQRSRYQRKIVRFNRMLDRSAAEIYSFDANSLVFVDVNTGACRNLGYTRKELLHMTPLDLKPLMSPHAFEQLLAPLRAGSRHSMTVTTEHQRKDGSRYPVELQIERVEDGNPLFVAIGRDISERVNAEAALSQALALVEASPVVSFRWRNAPDWPVEYVSNNVARWGYRPDQLKAGQPGYTELIHPEDLPHVADEVSSHTAQGVDEYTQEYRLRAADDRYFWVEDHTRIVRDAAGQPLFYEGVVTDIDAKKHAELQTIESLAIQRELNRKLEAAHNQLLQSEKMASIGQLAAGVAHELNNPIGFVYSNLNSLKSYLDDIFEIASACEVAAAKAGNPADFAVIETLKAQKDFDYLRQDIFQLVAESVEGLSRVKKIVQDLKDFSRPGATNWEWGDLHSGLDSTLNIVWNELKYKCTVTKDYGALPPVRCLLSQLNQVFMNLLVNAAHAIPVKGDITLRTGTRDKEVFVAVSDTGSGIAPENLRRIFDPFFTTKPVGKGTGLGLSLAYSIVQKHGGRIEVASTPGKGSTVTVWLPIDGPASDAPDAPAVP